MVLEMARVRPVIHSDPLWFYMMGELQTTSWWRFRETSDSIAKNSAYTGGIGAELFTNPGRISGVGTPYTFTGDNPDGYIITGELEGTREITEAAAGESYADTPTASGGHICVYSGDGTTVAYGQDAILTVGDTYRSVVDVNKRTAGGVLRSNHAGGINIGSAITSAGVKTHDFICTDDGFGLKRGVGAGDDLTIAGHSVKKVGELDAANTAATVGQTGKLGANEAYDLNGTTSVLTVTNRASIQGLTELWLMALVNPDGAGEGNAGTIFSKASEFELRFNSASRDLIATVNYSTTNAQTITTTTLATGTWSLVTMKINNTTKTIRIFINGVEASYSGTPTAGVGTRTSNTNNLIIGNVSGATQTWDGKMDEAALKNAEISDAQELTLAQVLGV